ncbi:MAG: RNA polymerase sporulation sigma factor SigK [Defluviitaleaceae bacterium]|nr:RNA polymerase sporulation sigma factor SigK [Defluviitaleaceae bacterium]
MFIFSFLCAVLFKVVPLMGSLSGQAFPTPLSSEEEAHYLTLHEQGDKLARQKLIEHNLRLVAHIVKKYEDRQDARDDLISIGTIGLIKGIDSFQAGKGTKLATYAARCIENEILMMFRANKKKRNEVSLQDSIGYDKEGNEVSLIDVLPDEKVDISEDIIKQLNIEKIWIHLDILTNREREIIIRRFGLSTEAEETQQEIAKSYNISRSYVSRIEKRALMKLYRAFRKD